MATYDRVVQYERAPVGRTASSSAAPSQCPPAPAVVPAPSAAMSNSAAGNGRGRSRNPRTDPGPVPGAARVPTSEWLLWAARRGGMAPSPGSNPVQARPAAGSAGPAPEAPLVGAVHVHLHLHEHRHRHSRAHSRRESPSPKQRQNRHDSAGGGAEEVRSSRYRASSRASPSPEPRNGTRGGRSASPPHAAIDEHSSRKRLRSRSRDSGRRRRSRERLAPHGRRSPARSHVGEESAGRDDATVSRGFSREDGTEDVADELAELRARALRAVAAQKGSRGSGNA